MADKLTFPLGNRLVEEVLDKVRDMLQIEPEELAFGFDFSEEETAQLISTMEEVERVLSFNSEGQHTMSKEAWSFVLNELDNMETMDWAQEDRKWMRQWHAFQVEIGMFTPVDKNTTVFCAGVLVNPVAFQHKGVKYSFEEWPEWADR